MSFLTTRKPSTEGVISTNNSMLLNLGPGEQFVGGYENTVDFSTASITLIRSDSNEGVMYVDQSVDDKGRFSCSVEQPFSNATPRLISSLCGSKYMRVRLLANNAISNGYVQTIYHKQKASSDLLNVGAQHVIVDPQTTVSNVFSSNTATLFTTSLVVGQSSSDDHFVNLAVDDAGHLAYANTVSQTMQPTTGVFNTKAQMVGQSVQDGTFVNLALDSAGHAAYANTVSQTMQPTTGVFNTKAQMVGQSVQDGTFVNLALDSAGHAAYANTVSQTMQPTTGVFNTKAQMVGQSFNGQFVNVLLQDDGCLAYPNVASESFTFQTPLWNTRSQAVGQVENSSTFVNAVLDSRGYVAYPNHVKETMTSNSGVFYTKSQMVGLGADGTPIPLQLNSDGTFLYKFYYQGNVSDVVYGNSGQNVTKSILVAGDSGNSYSTLQATNGSLLVTASKAFPVLQGNAPWSVCQANVPWITQQNGNITIDGSAVAIPSSSPYPISASQTLPVVQTANVAVFAANDIPVRQANSPWIVCQANVPWITQQLGNITIQGSSVALPSSSPYQVTAAQTLPVVQTNNVAVYASNAIPVLQANGPWSVLQANVPWITQQLGNITIQGSSVALPSSTPYPVIAAQALPVFQTNNVGVFASNAIPVLQANGPWSVAQANVPWITQQLGNIIIQGSSVALPSSMPYQVTAAQTLPVVQTNNVGVYASNAIPVLQANGPWSVAQANVPWITQQLGNTIIQGSSVALPSSTPYQVTAAQTLPVVQTNNVGVYASNAIPVLQANGPWNVAQANVPWITQQLGNITIQGSSVALPSSSSYQVTAAQTLPVVQTNNVGVYASNAIPVLQANGPWSVQQGNVPWITQQLGNITIQGSAVALPSSTPYQVTAAQTLPVVQTNNVGVYASNAIPVLQANGPWSVAQANVPWITQQLGNMTIQGSSVALPSSTPYQVTAAQTLPVVQTNNVGVYASNAIPVLQANGPWSVLQANVPWITQQLGNITIQGSSVALPSSTAYQVTAAQTFPVVQTNNVAVYASNAIPVLQANGPWSVLQANVPWITQQLGNITIQGSSVALPSSTPYQVTAAQTLPVIQTNNVAVYASNAIPVLQANGPWSVLQANVPWITQQLGNISIQGSSVALPSSSPYLVTAAQTLPVVQTNNVAVYASNAIPVLQANGPWNVAQANVPWITQQLGNITIQGSSVALPSSSPYQVTAAQTLPVVQTNNVAVYASNAIPVLQANGPWSVLQANVPWITQQLGNITIQGSSVALPSSSPYLVTAAQTLPVVQTNNVAVYASNAIPVLQANGPWSVLQANVPWITQQSGNITIQGSSVALPSSSPYQVTAAQTLPVVQTKNVAVYASNAIPVLQANGPWSVLQANVPWITQQSGNITIQGSSVALPSSSPYQVTAAQTLPVVQTNNVAIYASNAIPVLQANGPWSVLQANVPWITQQSGNITIQGSSVALPSSTPYQVIAAQTLPVVQTNNVAVYASNAIPVLQANVPWITQQLGNITIQGSSVALPSSSPYQVTAAQTLPVVQTNNVGVYASNAIPVLQANGPWTVLQANVPWITQQFGNITIQGSSVALPSSSPYLVTAAQTLPVVQTNNVGVYATNAIPVLQANGPWSVLQANVPWITQQSGNIIIQGSSVALPSSSPYLVTAASTLPVVQTNNVGVYASNAIPVVQANVPWITQQLGNMTIQGSSVALPSSSPYPVIAAQTLPVVQTNNVGVYATNAIPVLQANGPWSVLQANVPWITQQSGNITIQGSSVALPSSSPYQVIAAQTLPVVQTNNVGVYATNLIPVVQANVPWITQQLGNITIQGSSISIPSSTPYQVIAAQTLPVVQTNNVAVYASNAIPVVQANVPWITQQLGNITIQGSSVALPSSTPYQVIAAQTLPVVQTNNVGIYASNAIPVIQANLPWLTQQVGNVNIVAAQPIPVTFSSNIVQISGNTVVQGAVVALPSSSPYQVTASQAFPVLQANVPWITQQLGNVVIQGSSIALPSSSPYQVTAAQAFPVLQANVPWITQQSGNVVIQGSSIALPSSSPYQVTASQAFPVLQANVPWITQQSGNVVIQGSSIALPSSSPYQVTAAQAFPVLQANVPWSVCQANVPWITQQSGNVVIQGSSVALPSSSPYQVTAAQAFPVLQANVPWSVCQANVPWITQQLGNVVIQGSSIALPSSSPYLVQGVATLGAPTGSSTPCITSKALTLAQEVLSNAAFTTVSTANGFLMVAPQFFGNVSSNVTDSTSCAVSKSVLVARETVSNTSFNTLTSANGALIVAAPGIYNASLGANLSYTTPAIAVRSMLSANDGNNTVSILRSANAILFTTPQYSGSIQQSLSANTPADAVRATVSTVDMSSNAYVATLGTGGWMAVNTNPYLLGTAISDNSACNLQKVVVAGRQNANTYAAVQATSSGYLMAAIEEPRNGLGDLRCAQETAIIHMNFSYAVNPLFVASYVSGGSLTQSGGSVTLTGNTTGSCMVQSIRRLPSAPGQPASVTFGAAFPAGSSALVGFGSLQEGLYFGNYNGVFGTLMRTGGSPEIRVLTVATAATAKGTVTLVVDGISVSVNVVSTSIGGISSAIYTALSSAPVAMMIPSLLGNRLYIVSLTSGPRTGTFSFSAGSTGCSASFSTVATGISSVDTFTPQASWSIDQANGSKSLAAITPSTGNMYKISFLPNGFGPAMFYIQDPTSGRYKPVHGISSRSIMMQRPTLPLIAYAGPSSSLVISHSLLTLSGKYPFGSPAFAPTVFNYSSTSTGLTVSTTNSTNIITLCNLPVVNSIDNRQIVQLNQISVLVNNSNTLSSASNMTLLVLMNPLYSDPGGTGLVFSSFGPNSCCALCTQNQTMYYGTGYSGYQVYSLQLAPSVAQITNIQANSILLNPGDLCCFAILSNKSQASSAEVELSITWAENP